MFNDVIKLVSEEKSTDNYGDTTSTFTEREVFAKVLSIGQSEFYQAQAVGLRPELKFKLADYLEYNGEKIVKYNPYGIKEESYTILKTYRNGIEIEITCMRGVEL